MFIIILHKKHNDSGLQNNFKRTNVSARKRQTK